MSGFVRRGAALLRRDALEGASAAGLALDLVGLLTILALNRFIARMVDEGGATALGGYARAGYFGFVVPGLAISGLLANCARGLAGSLRQAQLTGAAEALFCLPVPSWEVAVWGTVWGTVRGVVRGVVLVAVAVSLGFGPRVGDPLALVVALLLSAAALVPFGILGGAYVIAWKRPEPYVLGVSLATMFLGGVYFPIELLPQALRWASELFPLTHAVAAFRAAVVGGSGTAETSRHLAMLGVSAVVLGPTSLAAFELAVRSAKRRGTLGQY